MKRDDDLDNDLDDLDDDFDDVEPVRKRSRRKWDDRREVERDEEEGDVTGGVIPYKNAFALISYYLGIFGLIPCLGLVLGPTAIVLGFLGLHYRANHPSARGTIHAIIGVVLGSFTLIGHVAIIVFTVLMGAYKN